MIERATPAEIQAIIMDEKANWQQVVDQVGRDRMEEPGVMGDWTFKDLAAHLTGWRDHTIRQIEAGADGLPNAAPQWPDHLTEDDEINDWIYQQNRDRPLEDVLNEADNSFNRLAKATGRLSEDQLNDPELFDWTGSRSLANVMVNGMFFGHYYEEHEPDVQAFANSGR